MMRERYPLDVKVGDRVLFGKWSSTGLSLKARSSAFGAGPRLTLMFRSQPRTRLHGLGQLFLSTYMSIILRDELERDLTDLAAAVEQ
jgi:hypothetical protein